MGKKYENFRDVRGIVTLGDGELGKALLQVKKDIQINAAWAKHGTNDGKYNSHGVERKK